LCSYIPAFDIATYSLIHDFLVKQGQSKAAQAVKKAAKGVVELSEGISQSGLSLEEIVREWKSLKSAAKEKLDSGDSS
jgi:hypothetical protein